MAKDGQDSLQKVTRLGKRSIRLLTMICLSIASAKTSTPASEPQMVAFGAGGQSIGHFLIADFDGDHKPDFATVDVDRSFIHLTNYSIHLQLSRGCDSAIGLTAPSGGLQLISRDVNGDDILDLVVRTAFDSNLVAVLLNDGHGNFTLAKPEQFPGFESEPGSHFSSELRHPVERISLLPSRTSFGDRTESGLTERVRILAESLRAKKKRPSYSYVEYAQSGRAPPKLS